MNSFFQKYGQSPPTENVNPVSSMNQFMKQFEQFKKTFNGDPEQMVMNMVKSGRISQQQYDYAKNMVDMLQNFMGH